MIKDVKVQNTGRMKMLTAEGETNLKERTFIFGRNTFGKSTFTAVLRSLNTGIPDFIVGRKRIGGEKQLAKVVTTDPDSEHIYTTESGSWNKPLESMVIFDGEFVRESVYTQDQQIDSSQQKRIETFMLGSKAKETLEDIDKLDASISENTKAQTAVTTEYNRNKHMLGNLPLGDFLKLEQVDEVEQKILNKENDLEKIKNSEFIKSKLEELKNIYSKYSEFDDSELVEKLSVDSSLIAEHYERHVKSDCTKRDYGSFLQTGARIRKDEKCPFCTQSIDTPKVKQFLETVDLIYDEKYRTLQKNSKEASETFSLSSYLEKIAGIEKDLARVDYTIYTDYSGCRSKVELAEQSILSKKDDLSSDFDSTNVKALKDEVVGIVDSLEKEISAFSEPHKQKEKAETDLQKLRASKERHGSWKDRCEEYEGAKTSNKDLSEQRKEKWEEYNLHAKKLSSKCLGDINDFLSDIGCNFKVEKFEFRGNKRGDLMVLSVDGEEVPNTGEDNMMSIKNTLSDSDRWILALAFFVVGAKNEDGVNVVVLDDPVSSFDTDRKWSVLKQIMKVFKDTGKQLIFLTHEKGFFKLAHHKYNVGDTTFLKLKYCAPDGTKLVTTNPAADKEFMDPYLVWISDMQAALDSHDIEEIKKAHGHVRKVIEHILKSKYPNWIGKGDTTVDRMLTALEVEGGPYSESSCRQDISEVLHNLEHHDNSGAEQFPDEELGSEDYKKDIQTSFEVIEKL